MERPSPTVDFTAIVLPAGPRVHLPERTYVLYTGPVEAGLAFLPQECQLADLWWPTDRAWVVYGDVDLDATYVAGSAELIADLLASDELEALEADPSDPVVTGTGDIPRWLDDLVEGTATEIMAHRRAELTTTRFTARFELRPRRGPNNWTPDHAIDGPSRASGGSDLSGTDLHRQVRRAITRAVIDNFEA